MDLDGEIIKIRMFFGYIFVIGVFAFLEYKYSFFVRYLNKNQRENVWKTIIGCYKHDV